MWNDWPFHVQDRFGCIVGSGIGGVEWFENNCNAFTAGGGGYNRCGNVLYLMCFYHLDFLPFFLLCKSFLLFSFSLRQVDPFLIPALISNTASGMIAIEHSAKG
jgi:3-oxoacyl-(acyl-carrier-protein) synthase